MKLYWYPLTIFRENPRLPVRRSFSEVGFAVESSKRCISEAGMLTSDAGGATHVGMRNILNLDDDVHATAKALARQQRKPIGELVSSLLREALKPKVKSATVRNGITLFPVAKNSGRVTPEIIRELSWPEEPVFLFH